MQKWIRFCVPVFFLAGFFLVCCVPAGAAQAEDWRTVSPGEGLSAPKHPPAIAEYVDALIAAALTQHLAEHPYWRTLLHFKRTWRGRHSLVDDPKFFLAVNGRWDAEAELVATLRAFFNPPTPGAKHAVCRFVGRFHWLKEQLALDLAMLPVPECEDFARLMETIQPESMTLVFPTSQMNSPASMFGHTFVAYETASKRKLLAYAVNYAAITGEHFDPLYAIKGVVGMYPGYFSVLPYYAKLQEYADIDHRDMWEYALNFTREETLRSLRHVYEMDGIHSPYYFFDENCSYNLLFLLDVARPGLDLTDWTTPWVIPLDTVRLAQAAGLTTRATYQPSKTTEIRRMASRLTHAERILARDVASGSDVADELSFRPAEKKARILDLAVEYLQYLYSSKQMPREAYTARFVQLLAERSTVDAPPVPAANIAPPPPPEEGHRSNRLQVGIGMEHGRSFQETRFRFAYHELTDYARGYAEGSQIVFADTTVRYFFGDEARLEQFKAIDIVSLFPRDEFFKPISWKLSTGVEQRVMRDTRKHPVLYLTPGAGLAYRVPVIGIAYALADVDASGGFALRRNYALGAGGTVGILSRPTDRWTVLLNGRARYYGLGDEHTFGEVRLVSNYALASNIAVAVELGRSRTRDVYCSEAKLAVNFFF
jgi:hypothetical protein